MFKSKKILPISGSFWRLSKEQKDFFIGHLKDRGYKVGIISTDNIVWYNNGYAGCVKKRTNNPSFLFNDYFEHTVHNLLIFN